MPFLILILIAYLLGSIPFGLIFSKLHGKDLRKIGSGNIGATNVSRALGKKWACFCFILDVAKGFLPTFAVMYFISSPPEPTEILLWLLVGIMAVVGHIFPIYLNFKGGKGVATSLGFALGLWPYFTIPAMAALAVWILSVFIWQYVSLASVVAGFSFVLSLICLIFTIDSWQLSMLWPLIIASIIVQTMIFIRHRENIKRIIAGTESKAFRKKTA